MDTITAIRTLRVIRGYAPKPLTEAEVRAIADSARKAGSSKNVQLWDFVTVRDRASLARLGGVTIYAKHLPGAGAAIALIVDKPDPDYPRSVLWDLGRAAQNIMLTAWEMGIGSCPITVRDFDWQRTCWGCLTTRNASTSSRSAGQPIPDDLKRPPKAGGRKGYDEVVHDERWGEH